MQKPFRIPIEQVEEFTRHGYKRKRLGADNGFYLFKLTRGSKTVGFEVMKGKKCTQPDGTKIHALPSDEDFGTYGWYLTGAAIEHALDKLEAKQEGFPRELFGELIKGEQ